MIAILFISYLFCKYFAVTATLLKKQNPLALLVSAWWPGGLTAQKCFLFELIIRLSAANIPAPQARRIAFLLLGHRKVSAYGSFSKEFNPFLGILVNILSIWSLGCIG